MSLDVLKAVGRPIYVACFDAPLQFTSTINGVNSLTILAMSTLAVGRKYFKDAGIDTPHLDDAAKALLDMKSFISNVVLVPKNWKDLSDVLKKKELCTLKGMSKLTAATTRTVGLMLKMDSYGAHTVAWCIRFDAHHLGGIAAKMGGSKVFSFVGATTLKGFRDKVAILTCVLVIVDACKTCYTLTSGPSSGANHEAKIRDARFICFCTCTGEVSKIVFIFAAGSLAGGVVVFGAFSGILLITQQLYGIYVQPVEFKKTGEAGPRQVEYPAWLV